MQTVVQQLVPRVANIWTEVLELEGTDWNTSFVDVGGTSAQRLAIAERLSSALGEKVHEHALFDAPTILSLAEYLSLYYRQSVLEYLGIEPGRNDPASFASISQSDIDAVRRLISASSVLPRSGACEGFPATFVLSPPRSGSTLFRIMLAGHSDLFAPPELNMMPFPTLSERHQAYTGRNSFLLEGAVRAIAQSNSSTIESARELLEDYVKDGLSVSDFYSVLQSNLKGRHLVERSTSYSLDKKVLDRIESEFECARYIHLLRHPVATICSFAEVRLDRVLFRGSLSYTAHQLGEILWCIHHSNIIDFLSEIPPSRRFEVRFEDIVREPKKTLGDVCSFLGIPFQDDILNPYRNRKDRMADGATAEDPKFFSFQRIEQSVSEKWKENSNLVHLGRPTWELAERLGYPKPVLSTSDRKQILVDWQRNSAPFPDDSCIHEMFEAQVARNPNGTAVETGGKRLTYAELNERADQLAHHLRRLITGPDTLISIFLDRSLELVVGILAVLKAGGAYLPIDTGLPSERVRFMMEDSACRFVVTCSDLKARIQIPGVTNIVCLDDLKNDLVGDVLPGTDVNPHPDSLAYVIYTSGSTGHPKGVMIEHRGLCNAIYSGIQTRSLTPGDRLLNLVSFSFDAATYHLFIAICSGATSVMTTKEAFGADPVKLLREKRITHFSLPASVLESIPIEPLPDLRFASAGGSVCSAEIAGSWAEICLFMNVYGPTETTIIATQWVYEPGHDRIPIGKPIANTQIFILDDQEDLLPIGSVGEIHIGGVGVARGYLNRPELTKRRFVPNPFGQGRLYKTGDLGRFLSDGNIEFVGRIDNQVKVNGFRIELGEIESAVCRSPLVRQAAALAFPTQLALFVVPQRSNSFGKPEINGGPVNGRDDSDLVSSIEVHLRETVPNHMVPSNTYVIERLPLTHAGKVDRRALTEIFESSEACADRSEPRDPTERALCDIWKSLLENNEIGIHGNFFANGGDSLLAVQLCTQVADKLGVDIEPEIVFRAPTVDKLATLIRTKEIRPKALLQPLHPHGTKKSVFFVQIGPNWRALHKHLGRDRPLYGIKPFYGEFSVSPNDTVEDVASGYVAEMLQIEPAGPFYIAGFSMGAVIAYEIAQQLRGAGKHVALLYLLDPGVPGLLLEDRSLRQRFYDRLSEIWRDRIVTQLLRYISEIQTSMQVRHRSEHIPGKEKKGSDPVDKRKHNFRNYQKMVDRYNFRPYDGSLLLSFTAGYRRRPWLKFLTGQTEFHRIRGPHRRLTRKGTNCASWIQHFSKRLDEADASFT